MGDEEGTTAWALWFHLRILGLADGGGEDAAAAAARRAEAVEELEQQLRAAGGGEGQRRAALAGAVRRLYDDPDLRWGQLLVWPRVLAFW